MKKIITVLIFALLVAVIPFKCLAVAPSDINTADAMNELGLFIGISETDYALDAPLTRIQGVIMVIRMLGKDEEANSGKYVNDTFRDVGDWADRYVAYAYDNGITKGVSEADGIFGTDNAMYDYMFITFTLRALGYTEENSGYVWDNPFIAAKNLGMIDYTETDKEFTRAEAVSIFWNAFEVKLYGEEITLAEKLISEGIFTTEEYEAAKVTRANGRIENIGVPLPPTASETEAPKPETPETDAPVTEVPKPEAPETDAPVTEVPKPEAPETDAPVTEAPKPDIPETNAPVTEAPDTELDMGEGGLPFIPYC